MCSVMSASLQFHGILKNGMGCHFLFQGDHPNLEIKPVSPASPALIGEFYHCATWEAQYRRRDSGK